MSMLIRSSLVVLLLAAGTACDKVPLGAPSGSTITMSASTRSLSAGESTEVSAFVAEVSGTPVQNGTTVRFTTNLGTVEPAEAETVNGLARTTLRAGSLSGVAQIRATSGGVSGGANNSNLLEISLGGANAASLSLSASSTTVPVSGGTVTLTATVVDAAGNRLRDVPVTFTTTAGALSSTAPVSNASGEATTDLTSSRTATVTARVGSGEAARTGSVTINVAAANSISVSVAPQTVVAGAPVTLTITPAIGANNVAPRVTVNWGDGTTEDLGIVATVRTVSHTYATAGTFTIAATGSNDGETSSASAAVVVTASSVSVAVTPTSGDDATTTFVFTVTPAPNATAQRVVIDFGDGSDPRDLGAITAATTVTKRYNAAGQYTVRVTQTNTNGSTSAAVVIVTAT
jgi:hypothetical protein